MSREDDDIGTLIEAAEAAASTEWEQNFMSDMRDRYDQYGDEMFLSDKQRAVLERLAEKGVRQSRR